jgi:hypothetical protein
VRVHQLDTNQERLDAGDDEKQECEKDVEKADAFVIDGGDPVVERLHPRPAFTLRVWNRDHIGSHRLVSWVRRLLERPHVTDERVEIGVVEFHRRHQ